MAKKVKAEKTKKSAKAAKVEKVEKKVKKAKGEKPSKKFKTADKVEPINVASIAAAFYAKQIDGVDKEVRIYASSVKETRKLSSGLLCVDWLNGGGYLPSIAINAGEEGAGKTTVGYHTLAASMNQQTPINEFWDAEGTLNPKYGGSIFTPFGYDLRYLLDHPETGFRYYRRNVIETMFNSLVKQLNKMPDKLWSEDQQTWAYHIPKRDEYFKRFMEAFGLKPNKKLTNDNFFVCPTDNDRIEGMFFIDSWAALVAGADEEEEEMSKQRAVEPALLSKHIKRVVSKLSAKQVLFLGTNQVRKIPGQTYGDPLYEPMGEALKFYSAMRSRIASRAVPSGPWTKDEDNGAFALEESVEYPGKMDRYAFKHMKSTKNKFGIPGYKTWMRVWVGDGKGKPRGFDPFYDTLVFLENSKQAKVERGKVKFNLKPSMGSKKFVGAFNAMPPVEYETMKRLIIGEQTGRKDLIKEAAEDMGIGFKPNFRNHCFDQLASDDLSIYIMNSKKKQKDYEDGGAEEL